MQQGMTSWGWVFFAAGWGCIIGLSLWCFGQVLIFKRKRESIIDVGRAQWASRVGLILAMAGNAIGLGNFLRFPVKAAANGGGAFMIPYFCALLFLGVPLMWVEWTMGRYGGAHGHGTTPGMFHLMWKSRAAKYVGALGIAMPFTIVVYYNFIECWTLAYAWFSATGRYFGHANSEAMNAFLKGFQGVEHNAFFPNILPLVVFMGITLSVNYFFLRRGISKGIEVLAKIGMPVLFVFAIVLAVRVFLLGTPDPAFPERNVMNGMAYIWNPDFSRLSQAEVWLVAAGQIFFTLSLGQGIINTYASYVREKDDIALSGLTTSSTNEFAEVVLGGTIAIPLAVAFFGLSATQTIAKEGAFNLGFVSLPVIFQRLPLGQLFGFMWFILLFIAGITSSVAMTSPSIAFLEDEFNWKRSKAVNAVFAVLATCTILVVVFFKHGFLDELDYWAGTLGLVLFAVIEMVVFSWIFGIERGWEELHRGADMKVPRVFKFIIRYVTPLYMMVILGVWIYQEAVGKFLMEGVEAASRPYLWGARGMFVALILLTVWLVYLAWKKRGTAPSRP
jgi:NSS family neurotransmitter:Na+ symporter